MRKFILLVAVVIVILFFPAIIRKPLEEGGNVLGVVKEKYEGTKVSIENTRNTLKEASDALDKVLGVLTEVEEKANGVYNFKSFLDNVYPDIKNWSDSLLKWSKEETEEERDKLNYENGSNNSYI